MSVPRPALYTAVTLSTLVSLLLGPGPIFHCREPTTFTDCQQTDPSPLDLSSHNEHPTDPKTLAKIVRRAKRLLPGDARIGKEECSICLSAYEEGDQVVAWPCDSAHLFHKDCIRCVFMYLYRYATNSAPTPNSDPNTSPNAYPALTQP